MPAPVPVGAAGQAHPRNPLRNQRFVSDRSQNDYPCTWRTRSRTDQPNRPSTTDALASNRGASPHTTGDINHSQLTHQENEQLVEGHFSGPPLVGSLDSLSALGVNDVAVPAAASFGRVTYLGDAPHRLVTVDPQPRLSPLCGFLARMDPPSQSPTQSNHGRSYDRYFDRSSPRPTSAALDRDLGHNPEGMTQSTSHEQRTLNEDDTGAVNFNLGNLGANETQSSFPGASSALDFGYPQPNTESLPVEHFSAPETPAPPHNPFAAGSRAPLLAGSQLFRQTQFSSAVRGGLSPTSSRPSPADFLQNSISPNPPVSSPLKARGLRSSPLVPATSSPQNVPGTSSRPYHVASTPDRSDPARDPTIPESSHYEPPRLRQATEPMDEYVSMRTSQERRETSGGRSSDTSDDDDGEIFRKERARSKKKAALRELRSISFKRPVSSAEVEVPSTNKKIQQGRKDSGNSASYRPRSPAEGLSDGEETVADSQEAVPRSAEINALSRQEAISPSDQDDGDNAGPAILPGSGLGLEKGSRAVATAWLNATGSGDSRHTEAIPETSPVTGHPRPLGDILDQSSSQSLQPVSFPKLSGESTEEAASRVSVPAVHDAGLDRHQGGTRGKTQHRQAVPPAPNPESALAAGLEHHPASSGISNDLGSSQDQGAPSLHSSPPDLNSRGHAQSEPSHQHDHMARVPSSSAPALSASSASELSSLAATPELSAENEITPLTQDSVSRRPKQAPRKRVDHSSPAAAKMHRREATEAPPRLHMSPGKSRQSSSRVTRKQQYHSPDSTDELARPRSCTPNLDQNATSKVQASRAGRSTLTVAQPVSREQSHGLKLFEGMAFAISFQSRRHGENAEAYGDRMTQAESIREKIQQAGGRVLANGFDELFDAEPIKSVTSSPSTPSQPGCEISLRSDAKSTGFAALIADGHSRKEKYMQALALGLPCIASRWVTTCIEKDRVVDWSPYLLCAGVSSFLGDAIRSRTIPFCDAPTARLVDIVEQRPRLLEGSRILLVMTKSAEAKKMAYVFLARALGASLSRVHSIEEGKAKLKAMENLGQPYDWVYVDEKTDKGGDVLFAGTSAEKGSKKRKRGSAASSSAAPPPKRVRTLSDERVIQSLILGRLIEEDEMEG